MRGGPDPRGARWIRVRVGVLAVLLAAGFAAVAARVFHLQVLRRDELAGEAVDQYVRELVLRPRRGVVADRQGVLLASSADAASVYADPALLRRQDPSGQVIRRTAKLLGVELRALQRKLAKGGRFVWLERRVPPADAAALRTFLAERRISAIRLVPESRRFYPKLELLAPVLGVVDEEGRGREGVELARDDDLRGVPEKVPSLRDGRGRMVLAAGAPASGREREGARVELTVDHALQAVVERALARAVSGSRAVAGMAVAIEPTTGEVLAMASAPLANPNAPRTAELVRNRPVTDTFEPGSTVKAFSIAAALDRGALSPRDAIDCGDGRLAIGSHVINDHGALGWTGASRIVAQSSNVGTARIAARLGKEGLQAGLLAFGLGEKTGVGLPGELRGQVPFPRSDVALATQSFGQGLTATALQVTNAMAAIANGGLLLRPRIVRRVVDPATGQVLEAPGREVIRRAVREETARTMTRWLVGVIEDPKGTGKRARLDGWRAAGKTGTAQKADPISRGYSADRHLSSFVGFAPADAPRIVIGVFVDEPKGPRGEHMGGDVAAPAFREIAEYALRTLGVPPDATALAVAEAPAPAEDAEAPEAPALEWNEASAPLRPGTVAVPALAGLPAREAVRRLEDQDLGADLTGSGRVISQSPAPGKVVGRGSRVRMTLAPAG